MGWVVGYGEGLEKNEKAKTAYIHMFKTIPYEGMPKKLNCRSNNDSY